MGERGRRRRRRRLAPRRRRALAVLVVPAALALVAGPPPAAAAVRRIDAWFGGRELMTSAWDQLARPPAARAGAADFVVARAAEAATRWRAELAQRPRRLGLRRFAAPVALALVGAFLHLLPGRAPLARPGDRAARSAPAPADVLAWREPASRDPGVARRDPAIAPAEPDARETAAVGDAPPAARAPASPAGGGTGALPGTSAPTGRLDASAPDARLATSFVDVPRVDGREGAGSGGAPLDATPPAVPRRAATAAPPAAAGALDARPDLPPALRAYAAAYLARVGEAP
jgi:hypothetical protein